MGTLTTVGTLNMRREAGPVRHFVIFITFAALCLIGATTALVSYRQHTLLSRGWRDATTTPDLPARIPLAGVNVELTQYDAATLNTTLDQIVAAGFTWVRQPFRWSEIEATQGSLDFSRYDMVVNAVAAHPPLRLVALLDETPDWARHAGAEGSRFAPPSSPTAFATFAGQVAARYASTIHVYQVWDEPNLNTHWGGLDPRPADYVALLRATYTAIHAAVPDSTVIAAALAPTTETGPRNVSDIAFLHAIYENGGAPYFDAAAAKPYGFNSSPLDRTVNADVLNFSRVILLREEMERQHDGAKALWGSNFGWNSLPTYWKNAPSIWGQVDATTQEAYTRAAFDRAQREWPWMGGLILEHWQPAAPADDPIQGFAIADKIARWQQGGAFGRSDPASNTALDVGLHLPTETGITYVGAWRTGPLGADVQQNADGRDSQFSATFDGEAVALSVRRADYVAYLYVTIDGQPANALPRDPTGAAYLLLTSPDRQPHTDLITVARSLSPGTHQLEVRAYLGYDRWAIAGIAVGSPADTHSADVLSVSGILLALIGGVGVIGFGRLLPWSRVRIGQTELLSYLRRMRAVALTIGVSVVTMLGMVLTFGGALPNVFSRETPTLLLTAFSAGLIYFSPSFIVTLASIIVLFLIVYNRPVLGLALIIFWIPFFLMPVQLYLLAIPMVELCLAITTLALIMRGAFGLIAPKAVRPLLTSPRGLDYAMLAFVAVATLTLVWSEQRAPAIRELRTMILEPALFYALLRITPLTRRDVLRLVDTLLIAGVAVCLIGLMQYFHIFDMLAQYFDTLAQHIHLLNGLAQYLHNLGSSGVVTAEQGSQRLASVYGSPNNLALFLGRCIPFALALTLFKTSPLRRAIAAAVVVLMLFTALLTQSIGGLALGIPAACIVVLLAWDWRKGTLITFGLGIAGAAGLFILPRFVPRLQGVLDGTRSSSFVRTQVWQSAISLLREHPLTGAGLDQFLYLYRSRYILPDAYKEPDLSHPHNFILDYWVSLGIAGLLILVALQGFFWFTILSAYRRARERDILVTALCAGAMGSMADFIAHGLVDNSYFVVDLSYVFCLTAALAVWLSRPLAAEAEPVLTRINDVLLSESNPLAGASAGK